MPPMLRGVIEMFGCNVDDEGLLAMFDELLNTARSLLLAHSWPAPVPADSGQVLGGSS